MGQSRIKLLRRFARLSQERIPDFSFRRAKKYYDSLNHDDKAKFFNEMERFVMSLPVGKEVL